MFIQEETVTSANNDMYGIVKDIINDEILLYIQRVILINRNNPENCKSFHKSILDELERQCTIRKFTILNTNVVRLNQEHVLSNDTLRNFYFELTRSFWSRFHLLYDSAIIEEFKKDLTEAYSQPPCFSYAQRGNTQNSIFLTSPEYNELCSLVYVVDAAKEFMNVNLWYMCFILVNSYAPSLFESVNTLVEIE